MSTVAINRLQDRLSGQWITGATGFLVEGRTLKPAHRITPRWRPVNRVPLQPGGAVGGDTREKSAVAPGGFVDPTGRHPRLPVPALEPPDRGEGRLTLTLGLLAAGALWQILSAAGGLIAGWDRFAEFVARMVVS